jgi:hypothetical protein
MPERIRCAVATRNNVTGRSGIAGPNVPGNPSQCADQNPGSECVGAGARPVNTSGELVNACYGAADNRLAKESTFMNKFAKWRLILTCLLLIVSGCAQMAPAPAASTSAEIAVGKCTAVDAKLDEESFVYIGGIPQWVTIHGADCANPVVLFLHGGPGNALSPYAKSIYGAWEKQFTLVQWDQRGAGMTFDRNAELSESKLNVERMAQDGVELALYLTKHLGKQKVILMGSSWGSILGIHMAKMRPDLFYAYVGTGQMVSYRENQNASYEKLLSLASAAGDQTTVSAI